MDKMREQFVQEIERLEKACCKTKSKYLKIDYQKAIKKMKRELKEYDSYRRGAVAWRVQKISAPM